ncbi:FecCD family ABC transporter permease [Corynebacterium aquatimens]|uniref:FecCD family ABC transporter permease n=1 Tax=Corynebacterium aquatimens TaxID=1190508 RepID=UPI001E2B9E7A|nr:iron chelate uptake ABC transporter family permease subunit [Corynebacterium aquatimens]WJY65858.1 Ferric enterobactin transport system permease protein FepG [Corynebacterium aquatimens]
MRHYSFTPGSFHVRVPRRVFWVNLIAAGSCLVFGLFALTLGDYPLSVGDVVRAITGEHADPLARYFVQDLRAPRVLAALLVGAALGLSGAIFQSITKNPLGSPDLTGFTTGAATGAVSAIIIFQATPVGVSLGAVVGGFVTGALVYSLSRSRGVTGIRFVLIGVGVSFFLRGVNSLLVVRTSLDRAQQSQLWLAGSFNAVGWNSVAALGAVLAVSIPVGVALSRPMAVMMTCDELATSLGVPVSHRRAQLLALGVILTAVAVAAAGPISFVALAAPQIAKFLARESVTSFGSSVLVGALLVLVSDVVAQRIIAPAQLPVGVVTGVMGGFYLIGLLIYMGRKQK